MFIEGIVVAAISLLLMLIHWIVDNAISLLWMLVVIIAAGIIGSAGAEIAGGIARSGIPSEEELKRRTAEKRDSDERQQKYWKERHKHENPQCEVCKKEEERPKRYGYMEREA